MAMRRAPASLQLASVRREITTMFRLLLYLLLLLWLGAAGPLTADQTGRPTFAAPVMAALGRVPVFRVSVNPRSPSQSGNQRGGLLEDRPETLICLQPQCRHTGRCQGSCRTVHVVLAPNSVRIRFSMCDGIQTRPGVPRETQTPSVSRGPCGLCGPRLKCHI